MNQTIIEVIENFRSENCIPEDRVLDKEDIYKLLRRFEAYVMLSEGIWPNNVNKKV